LETNSLETTGSSSPKANGWKAIFPPAQWVPTYEARWLRSDLVDHIFRVVLDRVEAEAKTLRLVVCDLSTSPNIDLAGVRMFLDLHNAIPSLAVTNQHLYSD
jgi:hypothetical protein